MVEMGPWGLYEEQEVAGEGADRRQLVTAVVGGEVRAKVGCRGGGGSSSAGFAHGALSRSQLLPPFMYAIVSGT